MGEGKFLLCRGSLRSGAIGFEDKEVVVFESLLLDLGWGHVDVVALADGDAAAVAGAPALLKELARELRDQAPGMAGAEQVVVAHGEIPKIDDN